MEKTRKRIIFWAIVLTFVFLFLATFIVMVFPRTALDFIGVTANIFPRTVSVKPIEYMIAFCLVFGIAFMLIGIVYIYLGTILNNHFKKSNKQIDQKESEEANTYG